MSLVVLGGCIGTALMSPPETCSWGLTKGRGLASVTEAQMNIASTSHQPPNQPTLGRAGSEADFSLICDFSVALARSATSVSISKYRVVSSGAIATCLCQLNS